jgi:DNA (cytosine-5)-methyltransferase 1
VSSVSAPSATGRSRTKREADAGAPLLRYSDEKGRDITLPQLALPTVGLFAGIGGIELGMRRSGHPSILLCENEPGAQAVLSSRFPGIALRADVCALRSLPPETRLLTAGFPCQDLSQAGQTVGITGSRSGLIGEVFRLLRRKRVPWVLLENVPFMLSLARGRALEVIVRELEGMGYRWAYRTVDSRAFGLPQRRRRVYLLASRVGDPRDVLFADDAGEPEAEPNPKSVACGFYWTEGTRGLGWAVDSIPTLKGGSSIGIPSPPAILMPDRSIIKPDITDAERLQGFRQNWTKPAEAVTKGSLRWKLIGNAVSVPVAAWIGNRLQEPGFYNGTWDEPIREGSRWPKAAWSLGSGRFSARISEWPRSLSKPLDLAGFLRREGAPLSLKASTGFRRRAIASRLKFAEGFIPAIDAHIERMNQSR